MASITLLAVFCCVAALLELTHLSCSLVNELGCVHVSCAVTTQPGSPGTVSVYACCPGISAHSTLFYSSKGLFGGTDFILRLLEPSFLVLAVRLSCRLSDSYAPRPPKFVAISSQQISDHIVLCPQDLKEPPDCESHVWFL